MVYFSVCQMLALHQLHTCDDHICLLHMDSAELETPSALNGVQLLASGNFTLLKSNVEIRWGGSALATIMIHNLDLLLQLLRVSLSHAVVRKQSQTQVQSKTI